uniref:hypothetical protein n=1 Tax=Turicimonas muris TaxID=1796652 RepID=UPI0032B2B157
YLQTIASRELMPENPRLLSSHGNLTKQYWSEMDERIRHHLRKLIWIAWKRPKTRERNLIKLGLDPETAWKSSVNGRGAWWNSGQAHMNLTIKNARFARLGLYSLRFMAIR